MMNYEITVSRGSKGFGLSLIYRGLDKFPAAKTGIYVARVVPGGSSHRAGLRENDKILQINKKQPKDVNEAVGIIKKAGKHLTVVVGREQPDLVNQGQGNLSAPTIQVQQPSPLSRSGSARSLNTQFGPGTSSRPQSPYTDSSGDERDERRQGRQTLQQQFGKKYNPQHAQQQQQQQLQQQQQQQQLQQQQYQQQQQQLQQQQYQQQQQQLQQQQYQQQLYEEQQRQQAQQQYQQQLQEQERQRQLQEQQQLEQQLALADQNRKLHAQQMELQRQRDEISRQQESRAVMDSHSFVSGILGTRSREEADLPRRSMDRALPVTQTDDSDDEDECFVRGQRSRSTGRLGVRSKSPGGFSVRSGISLHDLQSELSTTSRMSRMDEKVNMQSCNNRLAGYIDKVRSLQQENKRMTRQVEYIESSQFKELNTIKDMYEGEVNDLKKAIDDLAKNYRDLQNSSDKILQVNRDLKNQVNKRNSDAKNQNDSVYRLKEDVARLRNKLQAAEKDKNRVADKLSDILPEVTKVQEKISETEFQLRDVRKVNRDLEAQTSRLNIELKDKMSLMDTKLNQVKIKKQVEIVELSGKLEREYEDRIQKALAGLREMYETQMKEGRDEFSKKYEQRVEDLQSMLSKERFKNNSTGQGLEEINQRIGALLSRIQQLERERKDLGNKIGNMEDNLRDTDSIHRKQMIAKDDEIKKLLDEINKQMEEYQNLVNTKTALDMEIAVYRKLVESEEDRLGIDIEGSQSLSSSRGCSTPSSPKSRYTTTKTSETFSTKRVNQTQL